MNVFAKFDEIPSMILQDIKETKRFGHTVGRSDFRTTWKQYTLPQTQFAGGIKMKELECSQDFPDYKSMGIFPDAQGQLTPQSLVRSGQLLNASEML